MDSVQIDKGKNRARSERAQGEADEEKEEEDEKLRKRKKAFLYSGIIAFFVFFGVLLVLGLTVFRARHAVTAVNSINLRSLDAKFNLQRLSVDLNVTLELGLSVKNPNKVSFKYHNSSSLLYYRGRLVGEADIPAGEIFPGQTIDTHSVLTILADRLLSDSNAYTDAIAGSLPMTAFTKISGTVTILRMFKIHLVSYTDCELSIDMRNRTVEKSDCKYKTKY
ncbi:uncharacterized protein LOC116261926 [Nymphaea colorata]|nr:uncharacterized protein LOC116261926 [Nymphaea colorata]